MIFSRAMSETPETALMPLERDRQAALRHALRLWAESSTAPSTERRDELQGYKQRVVSSFFSFVGKPPREITALDVEAWRDWLGRQKPEGLGLKASTVYARVCFLSSFFEWAMKEPSLREQIGSNPARLALPKAPKAYQTESVKAWSDEELQSIVEAVRSKAAAGDVVGKRDYALLLFYLVTGMRRQEVISLRGGNIKVEDDTIIITGKVKGGDYVGREVSDPLLREALLDYLSSSGRLTALKTDSPLWTRHDRAGKTRCGTDLSRLRQEPEAVRAPSRSRRHAPAPDQAQLRADRGRGNRLTHRYAGRARAQKRFDDAGLRAADSGQEGQAQPKDYGTAETGVTMSHRHTVIGMTMRDPELDGSTGSNSTHGL
jgi:integrase